MAYSDLYRSAMNKVTASDDWKAQTLEKMQAAQEQPPRRKPALTLWKKAAMPLAAAAIFAILIVPYALRRPIQLENRAMAGAAADTAPFPAEVSPRMLPQPAQLDAEGSLPSPAFGADCVVSADSPQAALPPGTVFLKTAKIDDATLQNALTQLDEQLAQDKTDGRLSYPLTQNNVLASGVLNAADQPQIVFVLPASNPAASADENNPSDYLVYVVDISH